MDDKLRNAMKQQIKDTGPDHFRKAVAAEVAVEMCCGALLKVVRENPAAREVLQNALKAGPEEIAKWTMAALAAGLIVSASQREKLLSMTPLDARLEASDYLNDNPVYILREAMTWSRPDRADQTGLLGRFLLVLCDDPQRFPEFTLIE